MRKYPERKTGDLYPFILLCLVGIPLLFLPLTAHADLEFGAKYAGEFLTVGADARASAMGETGVAATLGVSATYWNPASLTNVPGGGALLMHADRFSGIVKYDFLSAAQRYSDKEVFGITFLRLGVDDIPLTALEDPSSPISDENIVYVKEWTTDSEMALIGTYAFNWKENWSLGVNAKIISKLVGDNSAFGLGFDIGAIYTLTPTTFIGGRITDVTTTFIAWDTGHQELLLPSVAVGVYKTISLKKLEADVNIAADFVVRGENRGEADQFSAGILSGDAHIGLEYLVKKTFALRAGMDREYFTAGAGLYIGSFLVDYAYQSHEGLGESHRVSLGYNWQGNPFFKSR